MKKLLLLTCSIFIGITSYAQTQLWGMTHTGGQYNTGAIFKTDGSGNNETVQQSFFLADGTKPRGALMQASDGKLYGMAEYGGANNMGVLFQFDPSTNTYINKLNFDGATNGSYPLGSLMQASDGKLYGMTPKGGANGKGVLFQFDLSTNTYTKKLDFAGATNGSNPFGSLMQASDGKLYGMTYDGGANDMGVLFQFDPSTNTYINKLNFDGATNGSYPYASLMQASDGKLYGVTLYGGADDMGVLFQFDPSTNTIINKLDFDGVTNGSYSKGTLMQASDGKLYGMTPYGGNGRGVLFQFDPSTNTTTKKLDFAGATNGSYPFGSLMQASDGKLYGMTWNGGANDFGVLFQFAPFTNTYTKKLDFNGANGENPGNNLIEIAVSISTASVSINKCVGGSISVPYTIAGGYDAGNVYTAQLSDATGSFSSPVTIGSLTSTTAGTILASIPSNTLAGTAYRIRVISSNPIITGSNNGNNITINPPVTVTFSQTPTVCAGQSITVGSNTYTSSATYTDVLTSLVTGCDSTVTTNLTVLPANTFTQTPTICAGQSVTVGSNTYTTSATYTDVFTSLVNGCDSTVTTNLTVLANTFTQTPTLCAGQSVTVGSNTYTTSATYTNVLTSLVNGCDSTVTTNLTVLPANTFTQSPTICAGQNVTVGSNTYTTSATYTDVLTSLVTGCDSTVTTNLTILPANTFTQSSTICAAQSVTVGSNTYTTSATYTDVLTSLLTGCDSTVTTNLTVLPANTFTQTPTLCAGQSVTVGSNIYSTSATYTDVFISLVNGCDSTVTTNLTVLPANTFTQSPAICAGQSVTVGSNIYSTSATYTDVLTSLVDGCDSIVTTNLTVNLVDTTVSVSSITLTASASPATYQWLDCNNGNTAISGATNQSYTATINGDYAVIVTQNSCSDTSACYSISTIGIIENSLASAIEIYPNPFNLQTTISFSEEQKNTTIKIIDVLGKELKTINFTGKQLIIEKGEMIAGIYFVQIMDGNKNVLNRKIVVQ